MIEALSDIDVPEQMREPAELDKQHLAELATMLRTARKDNDSSEQAVDQLVAEYRVQLIAAAKTLQAVS